MERINEGNQKWREDFGKFLGVCIAFLPKIPCEAAKKQAYGPENNSMRALPPLPFHLPPLH
jgi:hypothetical protein